jgi:hypothetical protein
MRKSIMVLTISVLFAVVPALGGPLAIKQVSSNANWIVHANQQQFKKTQFGRLIRKELIDLGIEGQLTNFATIFSFHPLDDVRDVTIYGSGQDRKKAVVLVDGFFDKEKILSLLRMNPEYEASKYGNILMHKWIDENKKDSNDPADQIMYGCFYKDDLIIMGAGLDGVKHAVDVLKGSAENASNITFNPNTESNKGAFFQAMALNVGRIVGENQEAAMLKQAKQLGLTIGEVQDKFYVDVDLTTQSREVTEAMTKMLEGILALAVLAEKEDPNLADLAKKVKISCEQNNTIRLRFQSEPQKVVQFLKEQWQKNQKQSNKTQ